MKLKSFVLLCVLFLLSFTVFAQLDLSETFTAEDDSFEFMYPEDWLADASGLGDTGLVFLNGKIDGNEILLGFAGPDFISPFTGDAESLDDVVDGLARSLDFDDTTELDIDGRDAVSANFGLGETRGTAIVLELDDNVFGMVLIITEVKDFEDIEEDILSIVATFKIPDSGSASGSKAVESLSDYDADNWRDTIAELEAEGLIASGGSLIFNEPKAFFEGVGSWFTPLSRYSDVRDIVMAAELNFTSDSRTPESCSLLARIQSDPRSNSISTYLEIGMDNKGRVYWVDREGEDANSRVSPFALDLDEPHHFLLLALNDELTVYIDGELVFDKVSIDSRSGSFGIALLGYGDNSRCEGHNIWAYNAPIFVEGLCEATAANTVNKRSGPGTNFDRAGTLSGGDRVAIDSQAEDGSGYTWYELEDGSWVREDVVNIVGDCSDIPEN